jgi:hypothetical protein
MEAKYIWIGEIYCGEGETERLRQAAGAGVPGADGTRQGTVPFRPGSPGVSPVTEDA